MDHLGSGVFDNFILADELYAKTLRTHKTCLSVNNNLCRKLVLSLELPITFYERSKITSVPFFIFYFDLIICELVNFTFKPLYWVILY